jgi:hypothetical protein
MGESVRTESEIETAVTSPGKLLKKYSQRPWWLLIILVTIPPLVTSYFSYRAAIGEAKIKTAEAAAEDKEKEEAGYAATRRSVEDLIKHDEQYGKAIASLGGHIEAIEQMMRLNERAGFRPGKTTMLKVTAPLPIQEVKKAAVTKVEMPTNLDQALYFAKKSKTDYLPMSAPAETAPAK